MIGRIVSSVLVGRAAELDALSAAYRDALSAGPGIVLVAGDAGIGKTRLLTEFTSGLDGARVLFGACQELGLPYAPFVTITRRLVREVGADQVRNLVPGGAQSLSRWLPELTTVQPGLATYDESTGRARLFEEMLTLLERIAAERPLVVVIEDLHWADPSSRELLLFLSRNLTSPGVLIAVSYRVADLGDDHPLRAVLVELGRGPAGARLVEPAALRREDVRRQLASILDREPDPGKVDRIYERSEGNPLFVEALATADEVLPESLRDLLTGGVAELPAASRIVLRAASVAGRVIGHRLLATMTDFGEGTLNEAIQPLIDRKLLLADGRGYRFRHALIRESAYDTVSPGERIRLHSRCAEALETDPMLVAPGRAPVEVAAHWNASGNCERALVSAWRAAAVAGQSFAYEERLQLLERVLGLWDRVDGAAKLLGVERGDVLSSAAEACLSSGAVERGISLATAALETARDPQEAAHLLQLRALLKNRIDTTGRADLEAALQLLPVTPPSVPRGRLLANLAVFLLAVGGERERAMRYADEAFELGRLTGHPGLLAWAAACRGLVIGSTGDLAEALSMFDEAQRHARTAGEDYARLLAYQWESTVLIDAGEFGRAADVARRGLEAARQVGLSRTRGAILAVRLVDALIELGRLTEAREVLDRALEQQPSGQHCGFLFADLARIALIRGDLQTAGDAMATLCAERLMIGPGKLYQYEMQCRLLLARQDPEAADRVLVEAMAEFDLARHSDIAWPLLVAGAEAQQRRLARAVRIPDRRRVIESRIAELRAAAEQLSANGRASAARRVAVDAWTTGTAAAWETAVAAWRELGQPYELAVGLVQSAEAVLAEGDRDGATRQLDEAAVLAAELDASLLAAEIDRIALRNRLVLGLEHPVPVEAGKPADRLGLTDRELDVLRLVAGGLSNREIGERLFIAASTAGVHVSNILAKLGATSRADAATIAHHAGLLDS